MATQTIDELDQLLASLNQLKPPGASRGKIGSITQLCVSNIQAESNVVQSLYRAVKKAPATHKLGAIYAIDSVVRRWIETAKQQGQDLNIEGRGEPGTYPAAVKRVTELMPALFDDIVKNMPSEQKEKLEGMLKIWEKGNTFPQALLNEFKNKIRETQASTNGAVAATAINDQKFPAPIPTRPVQTPLGYPPQHLYDQGLIKKSAGPASRTTAVPTFAQQLPVAASAPPPPPAPAQDVNSILSALANSVPKPAPPQPPPAPAALPPSVQPPQQPAPPNYMAMFGQQNGTPQVQQPAYMPVQQPPQTQYPPPAGFPGYPPQLPPSVPQAYAAAPPPPPLQQVPPPAPSQQELLAPLLSILPPSILNDQAKLIKALELLQDLQKDGIPVEHWGPVVAAFEQQNRSQPQPTYPTQQPDRTRDRSRSPDRRRRGSPVYGSYDDIRRGGMDDQSRDSGRDRYRQRSPLRDSPAAVPANSVAMNGQPMQPKHITIDPSLPRESIKVLSRTLFVGGAVGTQKEIHDLFARFGKVQTCIANREKRHAFVKMTTRQYALNAKSNMERLQSGNDREVMNIARQTKWGVGFGPRECCDYARGESIIPIHKLTDADVKWLMTAEYGGTGGAPIDGGMILEEPDIEIGAGVSSKAMSKRVTVDAGGGSSATQMVGGGGGKRQRDDNGPGDRGGHGRGRDRKKQFQQQQQSEKHESGYGNYGNGGGGGKQPMEAYGYARPEPVAVATPPAVPGFGFTLPPSGGSGYR